MDAPPRPEQRRHARFAVAWRVRVWIAGKPLEGRAVDVSPEGLRLRLAGAPPLALGEGYRIDVFPETQAPFSCTASVVHCEETGGVQVAGLAPSESLPFGGAAR
jgi:hypothetical protein